MFEEYLLPVSASLTESFGTVYPLFCDLKMPEHRGNDLCFCGLWEYKYVMDGSAGDEAENSAEVKYLVEVLGKRNESAEELTKTVDEKVIPALKLCSAPKKSIKRLGCRYSREQAGYIVSAELDFDIGSGGGAIPFTPGVSIGGKSYPCFSGFGVKSEVKTGETALLGGSIKSRKIGKRPRVLSIYGEGGFTTSGLSGVYSELYPMLGEPAGSISVGGTQFDGMIMSGIEYKVKDDGSESLELEFKEVDEA